MSSRRLLCRPVSAQRGRNVIVAEENGEIKAAFPLIKSQYTQKLLTIQEQK